MRALLLLSVLAVAGCTGASHQLAPDYLPLKQVTETSLRSGQYISTVGETVYVHDLDEWLSNHPEGSTTYKAALHHEQVHSKRQAAAGLAVWLNSYLRDTSFMWAEEQRGWYEEITILRNNGVTINSAALADILAGYANLSGHMVTREAALTWVNAVLTGNWRPSD